MALLPMILDDILMENTIMSHKCQFILSNLMLTECTHRHPQFNWLKILRISSLRLEWALRAFHHHHETGSQKKLSSFNKKGGDSTAKEIKRTGPLRKSSWNGTHIDHSRGQLFEISEELCTF